MTAVLTSPPVQRSVSAVVTDGGAGLAQLPQLVAQVAIRAAQDLSTEHPLVLTPPRYVDPDPQTAATAIDDTTAATFAAPMALSGVTAAGRVAGAARQPAAVPHSAAGLSRAITSNARAVAVSVGTIGSMLSGDAADANADHQPALDRHPAHGVQLLDGPARRGERRSRPRCTGTPAA